MLLLFVLDPTCSCATCFSSVPSPLRSFFDSVFVSRLSLLDATRYGTAVTVLVVIIL